MPWSVAGTFTWIVLWSALGLVHGTRLSCACLAAALLPAHRALLHLPPRFPLRWKKEQKKAKKEKKEKKPKKEKKAKKEKRSKHKKEKRSRRSDSGSSGSSGSESD